MEEEVRKRRKKERIWRESKRRNIVESKEQPNV